MRKIRTRMIVTAVALLLTGCTTARQTNPSQTATEQLLISTAADRAAAKMLAPFPRGSKVYVDAQYFQGGIDSKYTISAIRNQLLKDGADLVPDRKDADIIVEIRSGAQSIDNKTTLVGLPSLSIPIPLAGAFKLPEIALYRKKSEIGTAKIAMTGYSEKTGAYEFTVGPDYGFSHQTQWTFLLFLSWATNDLFE